MTTDELAELLTDVLYPLRTGGPIVEDALLKAESAIASMHDALREKDVVPKELVLLFVDLYPQILAIAHGRPAAEVARLTQFAEAVTEAIHRALE
jgi:hypothetical protein